MARRGNAPQVEQTTPGAQTTTADPTGATVSGGSETSSILKDVATALPIMHLLAACFFLYGYGTGFGSKIIAFMALSDVFIVSLRAIGQVYLLVAIPLLAALFITARKRRQRWAGLAAYLFPAAGAIAIIALVLSESISPLRGRALREVIAMGVIAAILFGFFVWLLYIGRRTNIATFSVANIRRAVLVTFALAMALGYDKGVTDRARGYELARFHYFECPDGRLIIRPIGAHFLSLGPGERWALVDGECEVRFVLQATARP